MFSYKGDCTFGINHDDLTLQNTFEILWQIFFKDFDFEKQALKGKPLRATDFENTAEKQNKMLYYNILHCNKALGPCEARMRQS